MWTVKAVSRLSYLVFFALLPLITAEEGYRFIEVDPVYWKDSLDIVSEENLNIKIDVEIISPCDLNAFPPGFNKTQQEVDKLRLDCSKKYHDMFFLPLAKTYKCDYKGGETMPIETGNKNVSVRVYLLVGYGSVYSYSSISGHDDISKMKLEQMVNKPKVGKGDLVKMVESKLSEDGSFADLLIPELKMEDNGDWELYSYILHKLFSGGHSYLNVPEEFLRIIGVEDFQKAFGDVELRQAGKSYCSFDSNRKNLKVTFSLPKPKRDLRIFHAVAFELTEKFEDYICVLNYNGPKNIVWSTEQNCIVAKDVTETVSWFYNVEKVFITKSNSCISMSNEDKPYFAVSACYKSGMLEAETFFRSVSVNQTYHIYCNGGFVNLPTEYDPPIPCPPFVFRSNYSCPISVNLGRIRHPNIDYYNTVIPSLSQTVNNRMLFPARLNTTTILMSEIPIRRETKIIKAEACLPPPEAIAMFIVMGSVVMILVVLAYVCRKCSCTVNTVASIKF